MNPNYINVYFLTQIKYSVLYFNKKLYKSIWGNCSKCFTWIVLSCSLSRTLGWTQVSSTVSDTWSIWPLTNPFERHFITWNRIVEHTIKGFATTDIYWNKTISTIFKRRILRANVLTSLLLYEGRNFRKQFRRQKTKVFPELNLILINRQEKRELNYL